jgi:hypothetical protein
LKLVPHVDNNSDAQTPLAQIDKTEDSLSKSVKELPEQSRQEKRVLCIPGLGLLDEAVALTVAQLVERHGIGARVEQADALSMSRIFSLDTQDVALACLCYVEDATSAQIRYAIRRLRRKAPKAFILVALLGGAGNIVDPEALKEPANVEFVKQSLAKTVEEIHRISSAIIKSNDLPPADFRPHPLGSH